MIVSDHNYQPLLPILLLLSCITRAGKIVVVDFSGKYYPAPRMRILLASPIQLAVATVSGIAMIFRASRECDKLLTEKRVTTSQVPESPRIAYFKTNLWFGVQAGGSIGHVAGVVNGFSRIGCPIEVFAVEDLPMLDAGVKVKKVTGSGSTGLPLESANYLFHNRFIKEVEQDLSSAPPAIIYQRNCLSNYAGVVLSRRLAIPLVIEYNGSEVWVSDKWGTPLRFPEVAKKIEEINLRHAHMVVVVSEVLKDELISRGIEPERVIAYPNCIDPNIFNPDRFSHDKKLALKSRYGIHDDAILCTFVGTFGPWHGVELLAAAILRLFEEHGQWLKQHKVHFMFVGDGQLMPQVRRILDGPVSAHVTLTGLVPQEETPSYLAASDILLSPHVPNADGSRFFGSPTKLFEYMAMGKGIVASDLDQIGEVLNKSLRVGELPSEDPKKGEESLAVLFPPGDTQGLLKGIMLLVENQTWREVLGINARKKALSKYTWEIHVAKIMEEVRTLKNN